MNIFRVCFIELGDGAEKPKTNPPRGTRFSSFSDFFLFYFTCRKWYLFDYIITGAVNFRLCFYKNSSNLGCYAIALCVHFQVRFTDFQRLSFLRLAESEMHLRGFWTVSTFLFCGRRRKFLLKLIVSASLNPNLVDDFKTAWTEDCFYFFWPFDQTLRSPRMCCVPQIRKTFVFLTAREIFLARRNFPRWLLEKKGSALWR